jgi:septum site-determining protein MinC
MHRKMIFIDGSVRMKTDTKKTFFWILRYLAMTTNSQQKSYSSPIEFKSSTFSVPVLSIASNDLVLIEQLLCEKVKLAPEFFRYSPVVVDLHEVNKKQLTLDFAELVHVIRKSELFVIGIRSGTEKQQTQATALGIP